jgi:hypothetical protein
MLQRKQESAAMSPKKPVSMLVLMLLGMAGSAPQSANAGNCYFFGLYGSSSGSCATAQEEYMCEDPGA